MKRAARKFSDREVGDLREFAHKQREKGHRELAAAMFRLLYEARGGSADLLQWAVNLGNSGELTEAETLFEEFATKFPPDHAYCMEAGLCKLRLSKFEAAVALFKTAYERDPTGKAAIWVGAGLARQKLYREALEWLSIGIERAPELVTGKIEMAGALFSLERFDEAAAIYDTIISESRSRGTANATVEYAYFRLGSCFERMGSLAKLTRVLESPRFWSVLARPSVAANAVRWSFLANPTIPAAAIDEITLRVVTNEKHERNNDDYFMLLAASPYGRSALDIVKQYNFKAISSQMQKIAMLDANDCIDRICERILSQQPTSLIRLGDGEGNFIALLLRGSDEFLLNQANIILKNWFGSNAREYISYHKLLKDVKEAISNSDFVGIPDMRTIELELTGVPRGYWGVYFASHYVGTLQRPMTVVVKGIHQLLMQNHKFVDTLRSLNVMNTISCHPEFGARIRACLGVSGGVDLLVPGEMGLLQLPNENKFGDHYQDYYDKILLAIKSLKPGTVTLLGAGICGKVYAYHVKLAGGIGIDIGAMIDYFMNVPSRDPFTDENFKSRYQWMSSGGGEVNSPKQPRSESGYGGRQGRATV